MDARCMDRGAWEKNAYNERHQNIRMKFYAENHVHIDQY